MPAPNFVVPVAWGVYAQGFDDQLLTASDESGYRYEINICRTLVGAVPVACAGSTACKVTWPPSSLLVVALSPNTRDRFQTPALLWQWVGCSRRRCLPPIGVLLCVQSCQCSRECGFRVT